MPALSTEKKKRVFASARFYLEIDGTPVGVLNSVDGGALKSEPIGQQIGAEGLVTRYPGRQKFDEITITAGTSMAPAFWKWIKASIDNNYQRRNGAIVACDFDGYERARRTFSDALISEIQFPALDSTAKSPAFIQVKFQAEMMTYTNGGGGQKTSPETTLTKQKLWVPANFQVTLENMDKETTRYISKIDPVIIKQNIIQNPIGYEKYSRLEVGRIEQPSLSMYVAETYAKPFYTWWDKFVAQMEHADSNETTGSIVCLASDCSTQLMTLSFAGLGITGITFDKHEGGAEAVRNIKIDMYCETMDFAAGAGTA
jgi:phage tail-like protein